MEQLKGYKLNKLPISIGSLKKISDLIEFEGPILSHFIDEKSKNYLFYWVDHDNNSNRWLIWKIDKIQLYNYLRHQASLKELMLECNKDFVYSVDIDNAFDYKNVHAIDLNEIIEQYVPDEEEYYTYQIPQAYDSLIAEFEASPYLQLLREKALYFKWNTRGNSKKFSETVGAADAGGFLTKISKSFLKYAEFKFYEGYKDKIGDYKRLAKIVNQFKDILQPRVVDLSYSSFKVALSSDTVNTIVEGDTYKDWQRTILEKYQNDVIDVDYSSPVDLEIINEKFPVEVRKEIFGPIVSIINDEDYQLEVVNYHRTFKRKYSKIPKKEEKLLLPEIMPEVSAPENKRLYTFIIEAPEGGSDNVKFSKKQLQENTLFSQEDDLVPILLNKFESNGSVVELKEYLQCTLVLQNNRYKLECETLNIQVEEDTNKGAWEVFKMEVFDFFYRLTEDPVPDALNIDELTTKRDKFLPMIKSIKKAPNQNR